MNLDSLPLLKAEVGYGSLGLHGDLGYEHKRISVERRTDAHALSAHAPSRLLFRLDGRFQSFSCRVALNDDVPAGASHADFLVLADGRQVACEQRVRAGEAPRPVSVDIRGAQQLELLARTNRFHSCHTVWLSPQVSDGPVAAVERETLVDCLGRAKFTLPAPPPRVERCVAMVVSPGFEQMLDDMLGSLIANGGCTDALLLVFILNPNESCERVAEKYGATVVRCQPQTRINSMSKAVLYSVARVVEARQYLCLDADMLVLQDLGPIFGAMEACPEGSIFACNEGNYSSGMSLQEVMKRIYYASDSDAPLLEMTEEEKAYRLIVNDGLFAGGRRALLDLDALIRGMPRAIEWTDGCPRNWWRNQFIFNLALARLGCGVALDSVYNLQLHALHGQQVEFKEEGARIRAEWQGRTVRLLHFSGGAKRHYPQWRGIFAGVSDPLVGRGDGDTYALFLGALRVWAGRHGLRGLAWSFYGTTADSDGAVVRDPSVLPLLATLHYLVRSNGCVRVVESGTARGISTACLASAVARRDGGRVVTFDPYTHAGRAELWATLPEDFRACIEARALGAIEGMTAALAAGEQFQAALLDSIHTEEHVWAEFQLAAKLVCEGGLILIHDPLYAKGTVEGALRRIEAAGYGVVRLWSAQAGVSEDDHLGLALIENRRRPVSDL